MSAEAILLAAVFLLIGAVVGFLYASARVRVSYEARLREAETGRATLEGTQAELRVQLDSHRASLGELQSRLDTESASRVAAETARAKSEENLAEQRQAFDQTKAEMKSVFEALALDALTKSSDQFLKQAAERFNGLRQQASTELETRKVAIEGLVTPLAEALKTLQVQVTQVSQTNTNLANRVLELNQETGTLATALRQPRIRGSWGELTLRRAVELAGMSSHCDFVEQQTFTGESGRLRPDLIVHLPGGRDIAVDAKVPLDAFLRAAEASERDRQKEMEEHVRLVRSHLRQLASKSYWSQFDSAPEFVVLFMPGESFFSAALESDRQLLEDALGGEEKVLPASPITLIALLMAVEHGWRQHQMEQNAARISSLGKELYERLQRFLEYLDGVRKGLKSAGDAYNSAIGSLDRMLLPSARKLRDLGVSSEAELATLKPVEIELREPPEAEEPDGPAET
ncbi:MAG: DNA recombination protein RmuC [Acidobacteriota bacterium]|nr:DNA recombination protein RmuC [Acidobacteriota bacterium]